MVCKRNSGWKYHQYITFQSKKMILSCSLIFIRSARVTIVVYLSLSPWWLPIKKPKFLSLQFIIHAGFLQGIWMSKIFKLERKIFEVIISLADYFVNKIPGNIHDILVLVWDSIHIVLCSSYNHQIQLFDFNVENLNVRSL